jgi:hypothetical protein
MDAIKSSNNQVGIQFISTHMDYKETYPDGTTVDTEKGGVQGFGLSLTAMKDILLGNDYLKAQFNRSTGGVDYVGSLNGGCYFLTCVAIMGKRIMPRLWTLVYVMEKDLRLTIIC